MDGHENGYGAAPLPIRAPMAELPAEEEAGLTADGENEAPLAEPPHNNENQENEIPAATTRATATIENLCHAIAVTRQTAIIAAITAQQSRDEQRAEAQRSRERHEAEQIQLQRMTQVLEGILRDQRMVTDYVGYRIRHPRSGCPRVAPRSPIRHHTRPPHHDLAGASVWTGGLLSRTSRDRLLGAVAGAAITTAGLWLILISAATISYVVRR